MKHLKLYKVTLDTNGEEAVIYIAVNEFYDINYLAKEAVSYDSVIKSTELITDCLVLKKTNSEY